MFYTCALFFFFFYRYEFVLPYKITLSATLQIWFRISCWVFLLLKTVMLNKWKGISCSIIWSSSFSLYHSSLLMVIAFVLEINFFFYIFTCCILGLFAWIYVISATDHRLFWLSAHRRNARFLLFLPPIFQSAHTIFISLIVQSDIKLNKIGLDNLFVWFPRRLKFFSFYVLSEFICV